MTFWPRHAPTADQIAAALIAAAVELGYPADDLGQRMAPVHVRVLALQALGHWCEAGPILWRSLVKVLELGATRAVWSQTRFSGRRVRRVAACIPAAA